MPLDTEIKGEPSSLRSCAGWLTARSADTHETVTQMYGARGMSESTWEGPAAGGFRSVMTRAGSQVDELAGDLRETARALDAHADDLDTALSRMNQARGIAREGGLAVAGFVIQEPGPAPPDPVPLSSDRQPSPRQVEIHNAATDAQAAYAAKVRAYQEASKVVVDANAKVNQSQSVLMKFIKGYSEKTVFNITDISTGLAAAVAERTSKYRAAARAMDPGIARAARYAGSGRTTIFAQARADALEIERRLAKQAELNRALASRTARMVDKLPDGVKGALRTTMAFGKNADNIANPLLRGSTRVLGKLPVVGLGVTALGVGYDISQGKDPTTAVVSGASSFVAGSLATAAIASAGGPVGWAIAGGAVVAAGVGFVVDEWGDDIAEGVGNAAEEVGDFFGGLF